MPKSWFRNLPTNSAGSLEPRSLEQLGRASSQRPGLLPPHHLVQKLHGLFQHAIGLAGVHLVRPDLIGHVIEDIAHIQRIQDGQEEVQVHFQSRFGLGLVQPAALLEKKHAELVESRVPQRQPVLRFVHAEAAGAARAGGKEDVPVADLVLGQALAFQVLNKLHQIAHRKVRRIALPVVSVLLAELKGLLVGHRNGFALVAQAFQRCVHQPLVFPGEPAKEDGGLVPLQRREGQLDRLVEVVNFAALDPGLFLQALAFLLDALANQCLRRQNLNQLTIRLRASNGCNSAHDPLQSGQLY